MDKKAFTSRKKPLFCCPKLKFFETQIRKFKKIHFSKVKKFLFLKNEYFNKAKTLLNISASSLGATTVRLDLTLRTQTVRRKSNFEKEK